MRKKIEIKVYLPYLMVGELESRRKNNARSKYIEEAIRNRLDAEESFELKDVKTRSLMIHLKNRQVSKQLQSLLLLELEE
jgi:metal-responsive CopG/Arc/MetJ family transcriptional regulator